MSGYYPLTPVQRYCPDCNGYGHRMGDDYLEHCGLCDGIGRVFIEGGPSFGCKYTLDDAKPGQIVTLGNGDRGRVIEHCERGSPTTEIALIDPMFDQEAERTTRFPRQTGVASMSPASRPRDPHGDTRGREDNLDPLQKRNAL